MVTLFVVVLLTKKLNGKDIIAVPLADESDMRIGYITHKKGRISGLGYTYLEVLKNILSNHTLLNNKKFQE